jgi:hypothetical protein
MDLARSLITVSRKSSGVSRRSTDRPQRVAGPDQFSLVAPTQRDVVANHESIGTIAIIDFNHHVGPRKLADIDERVGGQRSLAIHKIGSGCLVSAV